MLFNSYEFIFVFLPVSFFIYFYLNHKRLTIASKGWLVFASLFFYSWWNIVYLPLILVSVLFNFSIAKAMEGFIESRKTFLSKNSLLKIGLLFNIGLLVYFKYMDFFISNINATLSSDIGLLYVALPLAISFFTLQQIAFLVDTYEGLAKEKNFLDYTVFVTFFPQLIAGPIVHHKEMMPQFSSIKNKVINYKNITLGLLIFSIGLFKKVVIADTFAVWATNGFDVATTLNLFEAWVTSLAYSFQLYFDFSGYTDMAIGAALLFNIKLPQNFNSPYKATNIQDFWRGWHMTLSRFLRNYVYIPLGGNKKGEFRTYNNLMVTFVIGGLWHGAGWTFIFWGFLHGLALIVQRFWSKLGFKLWTWLAWLITFNFVNIAWVFFRAKEWDDAVKVLSGMIGLSGIKIHTILQSKLSFLEGYGVEFGIYDAVKLPVLETLWFVFGFALVLLFKNSIQIISNFQLNYKTVLLSAITFVLSFLSLNKVSEFLYFNF